MVQPQEPPRENPLAFESTTKLLLKYAIPAIAQGENIMQDKTPEYEYPEYTTSTLLDEYFTTQFVRPTEPPPWLDPTVWHIDDDIILLLNELGRPGARLRDGPGILGNNIIEILWNDDQMRYLHSFYPDSDVQGLYWLRVLSPHGTEGYISSQLVELVE